MSLVQTSSDFMEGKVCELPYDLTELFASENVMSHVVEDAMHKMEIEI